MSLLFIGFSINQHAVQTIKYEKRATQITSVVNVVAIVFCMIYLTIIYT